MNKKTYIKPLTQSVELSHSSILCASLPDDSDNFHKVDTEDIEEGDVSNNPFDNSWDVL